MLEIFILLYILLFFISFALIPMWYFEKPLEEVSSKHLIIEIFITLKKYLTNGATWKRCFRLIFVIVILPILIIVPPILQIMIFAVQFVLYINKD